MLETMESLLEELPDHPYIYYLILEQHFSMGQLDEAIKYLNRALENIKGDQQIYIFAGLIYSAQQNWLKSYYYYNKALSMGQMKNVEYMLRAAERQCMWDCTNAPSLCFWNAKSAGRT